MCEGERSLSCPSLDLPRTWRLMSRPWPTCPCRSPRSTATSKLRPWWWRMPHGPADRRCVSFVVFVLACAPYPHTDTRTVLTSFGTWKGVLLILSLSVLFFCPLLLLLAPLHQNLESLGKLFKALSILEKYGCNLTSPCRPKFWRSVKHNNPVFRTTVDAAQVKKEKERESER